MARLYYAYADALLRQSGQTAARHWFASAAELDTEQRDRRRRAARRARRALIIDFDDTDRTTTRVRRGPDESRRPRSRR